jgi:hypothetical protein
MSRWEGKVKIDSGEKSEGRRLKMSLRRIGKREKKREGEVCGGSVQRKIY